MWGWLLSVLALCGALVWTGVELFVAKRRGASPEPVPQPESTPAVEAASLGRRAGAFGIDLALIAVMTCVLAGPAGILPGGVPALDAAGIQHPLFVKLSILAYLALPEAFFGWTVGKRALGLAVVGERGRRAGLWAALLRNLFKLVAVLVMVEAAVALSTPNLRRLGDLAAGTVVVRNVRVRR
jgi:uncharacterized RDD family membrane protein YckC